MGLTGIIRVAAFTVHQGQPWENFKLDIWRENGKHFRQARAGSHFTFLVQDVLASFVLLKLTNLMFFLIHYLTT